MRKRKTMTKSPKTATPSKTGSHQGVAAVGRAFAVLGAFRPEDTAGLSLAELAARTGLYKSTILRLAHSLMEHRFLERMDDGRYRIGSTPLVLAAHYQRSLRLRNVLMPLMRDLARATGESVSFYVREEVGRLCLFRAESTRTVRDSVREGDVLPLNRGSGGRLLQAFSNVRGDIYDAIRHDFYYVALGERDPYIAGISAPVFGPGNHLAGALTISGPRSRVDQALLRRLCQPLLTAALRASSTLGGDTTALEAAAVRCEAAQRQTRLS